MISFSIFEVERQKFFIHATCFVILVNLNLIIFLFCPHFKYLPFPNVCHSSLRREGILCQEFKIFYLDFCKNTKRCKTFWTRGGLPGDPVFRIVKRNLITPQWMEPPAVTSVALDWTPSWIASIPNKYNPWRCFVSVLYLRYLFWYSLDHPWDWERINWYPSNIPQLELMVVQRHSVSVLFRHLHLTALLTVMTSSRVPHIWHPGGCKSR